jgi:16S rRNA (cytosine1402-N4)-methyltransferase
MSLVHIPVLKDECLKQAQGLSRPPKRYLDLTLGRGGHAAIFMSEFKDMHLVGVDQDSEAIKQTKAKFKELNLADRSEFHHSSFHVWTKYAAENNVAQDFDLILMDLGVSSPQLDDYGRGFSFYNDGPLDMRMNQDQELKADLIVNTYSEEDLNDIFKKLGEVQNPTRVTREIISRRELTPFSSTLELSKLIEAKEGWRKKGSHPATRYFLALRMAVNNELQGLQDSLPEIMNCLKDGGRLLVITFHSLEDRIVKYIFKDSEIGFPVTKKVIKPSREEILKNPRSRSALLRVFEKGEKNEKRNKYKS